MEKLDLAVTGVGPEKTGADGVGDRQADAAPDERAEHPRDGGRAQAVFKQDNQARQGEGKTDIGEHSDWQRLKDGGGVSHRGDE